MQFSCLSKFKASNFKQTVWGVGLGVACVTLGIILIGDAIVCTGCVCGGDSCFSASDGRMLSTRNRFDDLSLLFVSYGDERSDVIIGCCFIIGSNGEKLGANR